MSALDNQMARGAGHAFGQLLEDAETASRQLNAEKHCLADQFMVALRISPHAHVRTPGWGAANNHASVLDVIYDEFAAPGDSSLAGLIEIVYDAAKNGNERAQAWVTQAAKRYAEFHAGEHA